MALDEGLFRRDAERYDASSVNNGLGFQISDEITVPVTRQGAMAMSSAGLQSPPFKIQLQKETRLDMQSLGSRGHCGSGGGAMPVFHRTRFDPRLYI